MASYPWSTAPGTCGQRHHDRLVDEWNHDGKHRWVDDHRSGNWSDLHPEPSGNTLGPKLRQVINANSTGPGSGMGR